MFLLTQHMLHRPARTMLICCYSRYLEILLRSWHWITNLFVCDFSLKHAQKNQTLDSNHVQMVVKERAEIANRWLLTSTLASSLLKHFFRTIDHKKCNEKRLRDGLSEDEHVSWIFWNRHQFGMRVRLCKQNIKTMFHSPSFDYASKTAKHCFTRPVIEIMQAKLNNQN